MAKKILREWQIKKSSDAREVFLENVHGNRLLVMAGRQVATKERLELLALGTCGRIEDGLTLEASIVAAWQLHALPVICWSPGKWWFSRGTVVSRTVAKLRSVAPEKLLFLGDTALRPSGFPNIGLLAREQALKHVIFAGSDPLPFSGEEERLGRYGMGFTGAAPSSYLIDWIKENVALSANPTFTIGARLNSAAVLARLITLKRSRR